MILKSYFILHCFCPPWRMICLDLANFLKLLYIGPELLRSGVICLSLFPNFLRKAYRVHFRILGCKLFLSTLPITFSWRDVINVIFFAQHRSSVALKQTSEHRTLACSAVGLWCDASNRRTFSVTIGLWRPYLTQPIGLLRRASDFGVTIGVWTHR